MAVTLIEPKMRPAKVESTRMCCEKVTTMCVLLVVCYALIAGVLFMIWRKVSTG
jgi:hypothetical protein